jgi:hypothetical protein
VFLQRLRLLLGLVVAVGVLAAENRTGYQPWANEGLKPIIRANHEAGYCGQPVPYDLATCLLALTKLRSIAVRQPGH